MKHYLETCNATEAAKLAGYSPKTAYSIGEENLKKPEIKKAIEDQQQILMTRSEITKDRIIQELSRYAFRWSAPIVSTTYIESFQIARFIRSGCKVSGTGGL